MGYPLVVCVVSGAFFAIVLRQYLQRRKPYQLAWSISLASASAGSLAYVVFLGAGRPELAFRLYYILGALLTAPLLGIGSLLLISRTPGARRRASWAIGAILLACLAGAILLLVNPIHSDLLRQLNGGPGTQPDVYVDGPWKPILIAVNIVGALCVFGVAVYSGWQLYKRSGTRRLVVANGLLALGTYVISQAGGQARTGFGAGAFWLTMTLGWIILFGGFLCTFSPRLERVGMRQTLARRDPATA
jgi:hypothetical protein